jgi:hypothetical protein
MTVLEYSCKAKSSISHYVTLPIGTTYVFSTLNPIFYGAYVTNLDSAHISLVL